MPIPTRFSFSSYPLLLSGLLLASLCLCTITPAVAQEDITRKRVGLVLSGGAAYGFAHLGVLKWMEEHHVPVDYIAGTSMGSLMGGFYATGMSVPEMEEELAQIDWDDLFRSTIPHTLRTFRRKEDAREMQNNIEFGKGFATQTGLDSVYPVSLLLSRLTLPYPDDISFDDLPIPFRCTSVELNNAKIVRFSSGSLGQAMRASMAIPLVFTTVDEGRRSYVDGGVFENLPTATMVPGPDRPETWKPNAVVTVRLEEETANTKIPDKTAPRITTGDKNTTTPSNVFDVVGRLIVAVTAENVERSLARLNDAPGLTHIPLTAIIKDYTTEDFSRWREIMAFGYAAAEKNAAQFRPFQVSDAEWQAYQAWKAQRRRRSMTPLIVTVVPQDPSRKFDPRLNTYLLTRLRKYAGRTFTIPQNGVPGPATRALTNDLNNLTGTGIFESISYNQMTLGNKPVLAIRPKEKPYGPPFFLANLKIDSGDTDNVQTTFHVRANFIGRGLDASDEYRTDVYLGSRREIRWEWYRPLPTRPFFLMPSAYTRKFERGIYTQDTAGATFATDETAVGLDAGLDLGRSDQVRLGQRFGKRLYTPRGIPTLTNDRGNMVATSLRYVHDSQDDPIVPRSGLYSTLLGEWYQKAPATPNGYGQVSAEGWHAFPLSRRETIHVALGAGEQTNGTTPVAEQFVLGGPFRLTSAFSGEIRGQRYRYGTAGYVRQMTPRFALLGGAFYLGGWYEQGMVESQGQRTQRHDIHLAAFAPTLVGPVVVGAGIGDGGKKRIYVRFGRLY